MKLVVKVFSQQLRQKVPVLVIVQGQDELNPPSAIAPLLRLCVCVHLPSLASLELKIVNSLTHGTFCYNFYNCSRAKFTLSIYFDLGAALTTHTQVPESSSVKGL